MIPAPLLADRGNIQNLLEYLTFELQRVSSERAPLEERWVRNLRAYEAEPETLRKTFPWDGAANIVVPVVGTDVDTTSAGLLGSIYAAPNLWGMEALRPDMIDFAARLQEFMEWAQDSELKMYDVLAEWIPELVLQGTAVLKQRYLREQALMYEWREVQQNVRAQMVRRFAKDRPEVKRVALQDFYLPPNYSDIQEAPWCAEKLKLSWSQLEARVNAGIYSSEIMGAAGWHWRQQTQPKSQFGTLDDAQWALQRFIPSQNDQFELFEFWTKYPLMRGQEPVSVVCTIHMPTRTYARIDFNPFFSQEKPYSSARFIRRPGLFYGLGLGDILWMVQEEASTLHNQRLDNNTVRNAPLYKGRRGSGIKQDEPLWPGRIILMDNPNEDLVPVFMGQAADSSLQEEQFLLEYGQRRSGVSDYQRGGAGTPNISYSTATTTIEMLRQGRVRLDQTMREIGRALTETGQRVVELYQQFSQGQKPYMVMGQREGEMVQKVLEFPLDIIRLGVNIKTSATNAALNKETQVRTNQIIMGEVNQFYQQALQAFQIVVNPQVPLPLRQLGLQMVSGALVLTRRTLDNYDIQDLDRVLPDPEALNGIAGQFGVFPISLTGGGPVPQGLAQASGIPALPPGAPGPNAPVFGQPPQGGGFANLLQAAGSNGRL